MTGKTYTVKNAATGETLVTGNLQQFDSWWNANRHTFGKWAVELDTRTEKIISVRANA